MKKGASHVDWVMSMGLFIIFIVSLFILLRPGVGVEHKPQALLDLVEEKVKDEIYINLKETPLIIKFCNPQVLVGSSKIEVEHNNPDTEFAGWNIIKVIRDGAPYESGSSFVFVCEEIISTPMLFNLFYIPEERIYEKPILELECNGNECPDEDADAELRATENKYYVYNSWLDSSGWADDTNSDGNNYEEIKEKFGFPEEKNFAIYFLKEGDSLSNSLEVGGKKGDETNVYVIEWKDNYITNDINPKEILVHIEVW